MYDGIQGTLDPKVIKSILWYRRDTHRHRGMITVGSECDLLALMLTSWSSATDLMIH